MNYDLRRLRLHELIERIPRSRGYRVIARGIRVALCYRRTIARVLHPALATVTSVRQHALCGRSGNR